MREAINISLLLVLVMELNAQVSNIDSLLSDLIPGNDSSLTVSARPSVHSYLYAGVNADNKTLCFGREIGSDMYSVNTSVYFFHSSGLFIGGSGMWYSQTDPGYTATVGTAGYRRTIGAGNNFIAAASYSRYLFNLTDSGSYIPFSNNIGIGLTLKNEWIGTSLSFNFLFGKENSENLTAGIFATIPLLKIGKKGQLKLTPELSAFAGPEIIYNANLQSDSVNIFYKATEKFGLLNFQALIPLTLSLSNFNFEIGYSLNIPKSVDSKTSYPLTSSISFTIGYVIPFR